MGQWDNGTMGQWDNGTMGQVNLANEKVTLSQKVVVPVVETKFLFLLTTRLLRTSMHSRKRATRKKAQAKNKNSQFSFNTKHNNRK